MFVFWGGFRIVPLWASTYSGNLRSWKRPFWGQRGLAFEIRRGPKNAERHEGLNAVANNWISIFLISACLGTLTPKNLDKGSNFRFHLKNLKMALVLQNHHQDPYWFYYKSKNNHFLSVLKNKKPQDQPPRPIPNRRPIRNVGGENVRGWGAHP